MKRTLTHIRRLGLGLAILSISCAASADLQFGITVSTKGNLALDAPKAGHYTVSYRTGLAKIERPDGMVQIFDFQSGKAATLDPSKKTYTLSSISDATKATESGNETLSLKLDSSAKKTRAFGAVAQKLNLSLIGSDSATSALKEGFVWVADGSKVSSTINSVSPLALIGFPRAWVNTVVSSFDSKAVIPVYSSMTWNDGTNLQMTVDNLEVSDLSDDAFTIPKKYTQAEPAKK